MPKDLQMLHRAAAVASKRRDQRSFLVGAVGLRADGALVHAHNGADTDVSATIHAEVRLSKKLDVGATVWVARAARLNGQLALAKPCPNCERVLRRNGVRRVVYSTGPDSFEVLNL